MDTATASETAALALQCQELIDASEHRYGARAAGHLKRTARLCSALTQQPVVFRGV